MNFPFREYFSDFVPYSSGKAEFSGKADVYTNTNENPFPNGMNRYPDPMQNTLRKAIAASKNKQFSASLGYKNILLGNGSDELIALLVQLFCEPKRDSISIIPPTFGMYAVAAKLFQVGIEEFWQSCNEHNIFSIPENFANTISKNTKLIFLCHPNNPTGQAMRLEDIANILEKNPEKMVVVDEAYIDFCEEKSVLSWLEKYKNLIVLHTFSKMWGLAGVRCGCVMAHEEVISKLSALKMPYNINVLTAEAVEMTIDHEEMIFAQRNILLNEREKMQKIYESLESITKVFPSDANFFLLQFSNSQKAFEALLQNGVIVRNFGNKKGLENCLRITIGTPEENEKIATILQTLS